MAWCHESGEDKQQENNQTALFLQLLVTNQADYVEHGQDQRHLKTHAENEKQREEELVVLRTAECCDLGFITNGEKKFQAVRHNKVRQNSTEDKKHHRNGNERECPALFILL